MARYVSISLLAPPALQFESDLQGQKAVEQMIKHWQMQVAKVLPDKPDLVILPEASDSYVCQNFKQVLDYYKIRGNQIRDFWRGIAKKNHCYIAYSAYRQDENGKTYNSTQIIDRQGEIAGIYNKNHLVIEENTQAGVFYGRESPLIECDFGKVACAICFDLNFDLLRQKYVSAHPDLIIFSSMYHGGLMQNYWAYSCRAHLAAAVAGLPSAIISPVGQIIASTTNYFPFVTARINLDCCLVHLDYNWAKLDALKKKYGRKVRIYDPGFLGSVLVYSETEEFDVQKLVKEFELELLDDYFRRALAHRQSHLCKKD